MQRQVATLLLLLISHLLTSFQPASCSSPCNPTTPTTRTKTFHKLALDDVLLVQMTLFIVRVTKLLDCAHRCLAVAECVMFTLRTFQDGRPTACQTFAQLPTSSTGRLPGPGAQSYALKGWDSCSHGYSVLCGHCLRYQQLTMSQADAKYHCHNKLGGGHLLVIHTQQDLECVMDKSEIPKTATSFFWFGADDMAEQGRYVWADGSCLPTGSSLWYGGQPEDRSYERCVVSHRNDKRLHNHDCSKVFYFACQIDI